MDHQRTEAYKYLLYMQRYLTGDLQVFHEVAQKAEEAEMRLSEQSPEQQIPEYQTTMHPYSFEFMFGHTVISRMTLPVTTILFATIDLLGFLTRDGVDYRKTYKNFDHFFSHASIEIDHIQKKVLRDVYRHGIAHNYFPKLNVEISFHSANPDQLFFKSRFNGLVLNVVKLESIVLHRLNVIMEDGSLYEHMDNQLSVMIADYETESRTPIAELLATL